MECDDMEWDETEVTTTGDDDAEDDSYAPGDPEVDQSDEGSGHIPAGWTNQTEVPHPIPGTQGTPEAAPSDANPEGTPGWTGVPWRAPGEEDRGTLTEEEEEEEDAPTPENNPEGTPGWTGVPWRAPGEEDRGTLAAEEEEEEDAPTPENNPEGTP
eukprot:1177797-Prorocentrum_minimum.AAC.1